MAIEVQRQGIGGADPGQGGRSSQRSDSGASVRDAAAGRAEDMAAAF
jgi:hypothetical protein